MRKFRCHYYNDNGDKCTLIVEAYSSEEAHYVCHNQTSFYPFQIEWMMG